MTIQEMHIAVNLGVQKIASFQVDNLLPQEIDHELNNAMDRFIKQRYSPLGNKYRKGFEQSQKRIDDLRNLVTTARLKAFYFGESLTGFYVDRLPLPMDYMFLVNVAADTYQVCPGKLVLGEHYNIQTAASTYVLTQFNYAPGYNLTKVEINNTPIITGYNLSIQDVIASVGAGTDYTLFSAVNSEFVEFIEPFQNINETLQSSFFANNLNAFHWMWNELSPTINSNQILFLQTVPGSTFLSSVTFTWTNQANGQEHTQTFGNKQTTFRYKYPIAGGYREKAIASYMQHDDLYSNLYDPFNTTGQDRIKYTIEENFIDIHNDNTFFTIFGDIKYIRQPKRMNNGSNVGCELLEHTHQEIVEMAIKSILEAIQDPRYNSQSNEVLESE